MRPTRAGLPGEAAGDGYQQAWPAVLEAMERPLGAWGIPARRVQLLLL